ncbi:hypothetical protein BDV96DRAFT_149208 [Lophiotrema nucula]|uniref:S1 motif domain-containing protein n=1 Tax=Lophiotrema nucula TaxID=690887 RepID=A0A6A5Z1U1_9PLEO|nr:hypothetical protein BDV96DRAFT_149208 [Lophiotrema nucula]
MALPSIALPGQLLGPANKYAPGPGTHIHNAQIHASIAGPVATSPQTAPKSSTTTPNSATKPLPLLSVRRKEDAQDGSILGTSSSGNSTILPEVDSIVLARITRLGPRFASLEILIINNAVCSAPFSGLIRREDIRATEKDKIRVEDCFRVGDLVRGVVISLGDQSNYYVSTARNEYGVVMATSREGRPMFPVSWKEFRDPVTGRGEGRKVAKPF